MLRSRSRAVLGTAAAACAGALGIASTVSTPRTTTCQARSAEPDEKAARHAIEDLKAPNVGETPTKYLQSLGTVKYLTEPNQFSTVRSAILNEERMVVVAKPCWCGRPNDCQPVAGGGCL